MGMLSKLSGASHKKSDYALPEERMYPIYNEGVARMSLLRAKRRGTPEEKKKVIAAVSKRYPEVA